MDSQPLPPSKEQLLSQLKLQTIQELISGDAFNIETLAKTTSLHPIIIRQRLAQLQSLLTPTPPPQNSSQVSLAAIFQRWLSKGEETAGEGREGYRQRWEVKVSQGDIVQVIGRVGGGKSWVLNEMIVQALDQQAEIIFLDGGNNLNALLYRIEQERSTNSSFAQKKLKLRTFPFNNQAELMMLLHSIGDWHSKNVHNRPWIFIDSVSHNDDLQNETSQSSSTIQFKSADKIRKLFFQLSQLIGAIVYCSKTISLNSLFETIYKHEKHRPKGAGSCAKKWDNLANKTICLDFARISTNVEYCYVNLTKQVDCSVHKLKRSL